MGKNSKASKEPVNAILFQVTGCEAESIDHLRGLGMSNSVSVANTAHGRFVVRTNVQSHLFRYEREAGCFEQLKETPVLTPTVLACGVFEEYSYSVASFIQDSRPIGEDLDILRIWEGAN